VVMAGRVTRGAVVKPGEGVDLAAGLAPRKLAADLRLRITSGSAAMPNILLPSCPPLGSLLSGGVAGRRSNTGGSVCVRRRFGVARAGHA